MTTGKPKVSLRNVRDVARQHDAALQSLGPVLRALEERGEANANDLARVYQRLSANDSALQVHMSKIDYASEWRTLTLWQRLRWLVKGT